MYNYESRKEIVGKRIAEERKRLGISQKDLLTQIFKSEKSHKTLTAWEKGERLPDLDSLALMADLFHCDIGYLLGDYNEHTRISADIARETGLSEQAIKTILMLRRDNQMDWGLDTLNILLETQDFMVLLYYMVRFSTAGDGCIEDGHEHIKKSDIFEMRLSDCIKKIADSVAEKNENKPDYRHLYKLYLNAYLQPDNQGRWRSLNEIQSDMEQNGLVFDKILFEGRERNG